MGTQFSPVVEAFLRGQQQQAGLVDQAKNYQLRKEQIEAAIDEAQKRHQLDQEKLELEHQIFQLNFKKAQQDQHDRLVEELTQHPEMAPGTTSTTLQAPGTNMVIPGIPQVSPLGGGPGTPAFNIQYPSNLGVQPGQPRDITTTNTPKPGTPLTIDSPFGPITLNMPESADVQARKVSSAKAEGELPSRLKEIAAQQEPRIQAMLEVAMAKEQAAREIASNKNATEIQIAEAKRQADLARFEATIYMNLSKLAPGVDFGTPGGLQQAISDRKRSLAMGETPFNSGVFLDQAAKTEMTKEGLSIVDPKLNDKIYPNAANAVSFIDNVTRLASKLPAGESAGGRIRNVIADKLGATGLSSYASKYNMFQAEELPKLDLAVGLTPGTLARSPKLVDLFKKLYPLPGDKPEIVNEKKINGADIFLTGAQTNLAKLSANQRKMYWQKIIDDNQELMTLRPIADKLRKAATTGNYNSINPNLFETIAGGNQ